MATSDFGLGGLGSGLGSGATGGAGVHDALNSQGLGGLLASPGGSDAPDAKKLEEEEKKKFEEVEKQHQAAESKEKADDEKKKVEDAKDAEAAKKKDEELKNKLMTEEDKGASASHAHVDSTPGKGLLGMELVKDAKDKHPDAPKKAGTLEGKAAEPSK